MVCVKPDVWQHPDLTEWCFVHIFFAQNLKYTFLHIEGSNNFINPKKLLCFVSNFCLGLIKLYKSCLVSVWFSVWWWLLLPNIKILHCMLFVHVTTITCTCTSTTKHQIMLPCNTKRDSLALQRFFESRFFGARSHLSIVLINFCRAVTYRYQLWESKHH